MYCFINIPFYMSLASVLTSKTIPTTGRGSGTRKRKRRAPEIIEVEDENICAVLLHLGKSNGFYFILRPCMPRS